MKIAGELLASPEEAAAIMRREIASGCTHDTSAPEPGQDQAAGHDDRRDDIDAEIGQQMALAEEIMHEDRDILRALAK